MKKKFTELDLAKNLVNDFILPRLEIIDSFQIVRFAYEKFYVNIYIKDDADHKRFILSDHAETQEVLLKYGYKNTPTNTEKLLNIIEKYYLQGRTNQDGTSEIVAVINYDTRTEYKYRPMKIALKLIDLVNAIIEIFETFISEEN